MPHHANNLGEDTCTHSTQTDFLDESNFKKPGAHWPQRNF